MSCEYNTVELLYCGHFGKCRRSCIERCPHFDVFISGVFFKRVVLLLNCANVREGLVSFSTELVEELEMESEESSSSSSSSTLSCNSRESLHSLSSQASTCQMLEYNTTVKHSLAHAYTSSDTHLHPFSLFASLQDITYLPGESGVLHDNTTAGASQGEEQGARVLLRVEAQDILKTVAGDQLLRGGGGKEGGGRHSPGSKSNLCFSYIYNTNSWCSHLQSMINPNLGVFIYNTTPILIMVYSTILILTLVHSSTTAD